MKRRQGSKQKKHIINELIPYDKMHVITETGENLGVLDKEEAVEKAREAGLDLTIVSTKGAEGYPITKILDYGKALYVKKKQAMQAKKKQAVIQVKEIRLTPKIGEQDFQTKMKRGIEFLEKGKHLKINIMFKGREIATKAERGALVFEKIEQAFADAGISKFTKDKESKSGRFWSRIYYITK